MTKTILAVLAHPDDETFGLGGTLALYVRKGYDAYYVCATRGEVGSADEEYMQGFRDTAEMRTDELSRAAKILGLKEVFFLGYRDSGMPGSEDNKHPNAQVAHSIDEVAGMAITLLFVPQQVGFMVAGLIAFRFFDIVKPLGIKQLEKWPKGWGVMADDVLAGLYALIIMQLLLQLKLFF